MAAISLSAIRSLVPVSRAMKCSSRREWQSYPAHARGGCRRKGRDEPAEDCLRRIADEQELHTR